MRFLNRALAVLLGLLTWSNLAAAQCPKPDLLDGGPCCAQAQLNLPFFPNFQQGSIEICWRDCNVNGVIPYVARWSNLNFAAGGVGGLVPPCGETMATLELRAGGVLQWAGKMRMLYSRTWMETGPGGFPIQVWRFLINGDLQQMATTMLVPCPVPPCAPLHGGRVRVTGYMDQAMSCAIVPSTFQRAWMLTHACDFIDHAPGFPRAGAFHPDRSYSWVGPSAGFVPGPLQPIEGTPAAGSPFEAMRDRNLLGPPPGIASCIFEERALHVLTPNNQFCMCGAPGTNQFMLGNLSVNGACGSTITTPGFPFLPGYISMGIGAWTIPGTFPGLEQLRWNAGGYNHFDACTGALTQEVYYGVTTIGGFAAQQLLSTGVGGPLPLRFIDQANSLMPPTGPGTVMNIPYVSDHILNLNN